MSISVAADERSVAGVRRKLKYSLRFHMRDMRRCCKPSKSVTDPRRLVHPHRARRLRARRATMLTLAIYALAAPLALDSLETLDFDAWAAHHNKQFAIEELSSRKSTFEETASW